ncbi:hypothetical protein [Scandinavium sp.]|uniref:hypothetical protein n=1 Tax=Scandinavium sp. TaxID=2830653 RepID=UPI002E316ED6|nr:hypothetical protein [Scandinavium sp.]
MSFNRTPLALEDVKRVLDRALNATRGLEVNFKTRGEAIYWRGRANYFRRLDRRENAQIYDETHILHKQSIYDKLRLELSGTAVLIKKVEMALPDMREI